VRNHLTDRPPRGPSVFRRLVRHQVLLLALLFFGVSGFVFLRSGEVSDWQNVFVRAARRLQAGEPLYRPGDNYTYPPAMAMLSVPLANLPASLSLWSWYLVNVGATATTFLCAWRLAGGPALTDLPARWQAMLSIAALLAGRFFVAPLENRQFDMVIAALLLAGGYQLWRGHGLLGAALLGGSAAMKCTPLLFAPYLIWRGKVKAACVLVAVAAILNLLPDVLWPQPGGGWYLETWYTYYLAEVGRFAPGVWLGGGLGSQSLGGLFNRFMRFASPLSMEPLRGQPLELAQGTLLVVRALVYGMGLLLLAVTAWRFGRPGTAAGTEGASSPGPVSFDRLRIGMESAAVVCLMLLLSPMSSKAHYVVLLLPCLILARLAVERRPPWLVALLVVLAVTGPLTAKGLLGRRLGDLALEWGSPTWFALCSLVGIWAALGAIRPHYAPSLGPPAEKETGNSGRGR